MSQPPPQSPSLPKPVIIGAFAIVSTVVWNWFAGAEYHQNADGKTGSAGPKATADEGDITDDRFEQVKAATLRAGPGTQIERDPAYQNTVRITLPAGMYPKKESALALATTARSRLGNNAIVYVQAVDGSTIAKASPMGAE